MGQKIPLFGGVIAGVPADGTVVTLFTPPDKTSKVPGTYEVHLYLVPDIAQAIRIHAREASKPAVPAWQSLTDALSTHAPIVKALDGYVVRGDVTLEMVVNAKAPAQPVAIWGYYHRTGQGVQIEAERRSIGQALSAFNAGVPFLITAEGNAIIHRFEKNRIDEISLAFFMPSDVAGSEDVRVAFEDTDNNEIGFGLFKPQTGSIYPATVAGATPAVSLPPFGSLFPPSPYLIHQCPFGGNAIVDHVRVTNGSADSDLIVHGYFVRR